MDSAKEARFIGTCAKCLGRVMEKGCSAMEHVYHQRCFVCTLCGKELYGSPFYNMNGKPYCEEDYLSKLEKCSVCNRPILDKILKAQGQIFHPDCFKCTSCGKCLDGIPFTADPHNNILCMNDYRRKYAPQCWRCKQPIVPTLNKTDVVRVIALGHSYHTTCYRCEDCGLNLSSQGTGKGCYPLGEHLYCFNCNKRRRPTQGTMTP